VKTALPLIAVAVVLAMPVHAQERSAGLTYDGQTNWSALKASIDCCRRNVHGSMDYLK
jgi:hypothetical protein